MSRTLDDSTVASNPGDITLSHQKLRVLRPDLYGFRGLIYSLLSALRIFPPQKEYIEEQVKYGDSRAAVVVSTNPLLVAA
jgi:hypothetical protein